jgi:hypothetical protein
MRSLKPAYFFFAGVLTTLVILFIYGFDDKKEEAASLNKVQTTTKWSVPAIPSVFDFAGEKVPLERPEIKEYFDRNFTQIYYQTGTMLNVMKLANRWFPIIEERLKYNGIPDDFKYLCVAESNLQNLTSRAGAVGFWQFMPQTAPAYQLQVNDKIDERYHVLKSTDAASKYIKEAYQQFGSWTGAAASFNCGRGGYNGQSTFQQTKDYYSLQLPEETNNYMFRILSFKYLFQNAEALGYDLIDDNLYEQYKTRKVYVSSPISNLAQFAIDNGTNYKMLKILNPWLRGRSLSTGNKTYEILLPEK